MNPIRRLIRYQLGILAKTAIKKHKMELIVVAGWYGTTLAREMTYTILNDKFKVRRNTEEIWWDFSLPLAILGYKDKKRNPIEWFFLLLKSTAYILFGKSNPHTLVLDADCTYEMTAKYWASFIKPDYLLILNYEKEAKIVRELVKSSDKDKTTIIYNPSKTTNSLVKSLKGFTTFTFGQGNEGKLNIKFSKEKLNMSYNKQKVSIPKKYLPSFSLEMLGGIFSIAVLKGLDLTEAGFNSLKFELPSNIMTKIHSKLDFNKLQ